MLTPAAYTVPWWEYFHDRCSSWISGHSNTIKSCRHKSSLLKQAALWLNAASFFFLVDKQFANKRGVGAVRLINSVAVHHIYTTNTFWTGAYTSAYSGLLGFYLLIFPVIYSIWSNTSAGGSKQGSNFVACTFATTADAPQHLHLPFKAS